MSEDESNEGNSIIDRKQKMKEKFVAYQEAEDKKGIVYLPRIPPYMKASYIREYFKRYKPVRIYLTPEDENIRKDRERKGGNRSRKYIDGWIEFEDKRIAKYVATNLNGSKVGGKKKHYYHEDIWSLKYLPKFKWRNLTEKMEYDRQVRQRRLHELLRRSKKNIDVYIGKSEKSKKIKAILTKKAKELIRKEAKEKGEEVNENDRDLIEETIAKKIITTKKKIFKQNQPVNK